MCEEAHLDVMASGVKQHPAVRAATHALGEGAPVECAAVMDQLVVEKTWEGAASRHMPFQLLGRDVVFG